MGGADVKDVHPSNMFSQQNTSPNVVADMFGAVVNDVQPLNMCE